MVNPAEIVYWEILPAIRRELVMELKVLGVRQSDIAKLLDVTPSAISQYIKNKRAEFRFEDDFLKKIKKAAKNIYDEKSDAFKEVNQLVKEFEKSKALCGICRDKNKMDSKCGVCFK